jgi:hypothetical protein
VLKVPHRVALEFVLQQVGDVAPLAGLGVKLAQAGPRVTLACQLVRRVAPGVDRTVATGGLGVARGVEELLLVRREGLAVDLDRLARDRGCCLCRGLVGRGLVRCGLVRCCLVRRCLVRRGLVRRCLSAAALSAAALSAAALSAAALSAAALSARCLVRSVLSIGGSGST